MFKNFYEARDAFDALLLGDTAERTAVTDRAIIAVFRVLLENTLYKGTAYGHVRHDRTKQEVLGKLTGYGRTTIVDALNELERLDMIKRTSRRPGQTGSASDEIRITWPKMWGGESSETEHSAESSASEHSPVAEHSVPETEHSGGPDCSETEHSYKEGNKRKEKNLEEPQDQAKPGLEVADISLNPKQEQEQRPEWLNEVTLGASTPGPVQPRGALAAPQHVYITGPDMWAFPPPWRLPFPGKRGLGEYSWYVPSDFVEEYAARHREDLAASRSAQREAQKAHSSALEVAR